MSRKILSLDIRSDGINAVLVKSSLRESRIAACLSVPIPETAPDVANPWRAALETVVAQMDLAGTDCAVSIPAVFFSSRNLQVPFSNAKKIRMVLPFELEPSLPFQADDLTIDFSAREGGADPGGTEVLAVAIEKERLATALVALAGVGIDPERVTVSGLPIAAWLGRSAAPEDAFFVDDDARNVEAARRARWEAPVREHLLWALATAAAVLAHRMSVSLPSGLELHYSGAAFLALLLGYPRALLSMALVLALVPGQYLVAVDRQNWALLATILVTVLGADQLPSLSWATKLKSCLPGIKPLGGACIVRPS